MKRRGHTAFHGTLQGIKAQIGTVGAGQGVVRDALAGLNDQFAILEQRVTRLEQAGAGTGAGDVLIDRLAVCEGRLAVLEKLIGAAPHQPSRGWLSRLLMLGVSPSQRRFVVNEGAATGLRAAGYETLEQILDEPGTADLAPWEVIHAKWAEAYQADPSQVAEPPDVSEVEEFYRICQELLRPPAP